MFQPKPIAIDALAYSFDLGILAEGLSDGSLRLREPSNLSVTSTICGSSSKSTRKVLFYKNFLIACGVHGSVVMWDVSTLEEVASVDSSQGAVWDMALDRDKLYLATETGCVVVVALSDSDMRTASFWRSSAKSGEITARALSICVESGYVFVGDANGQISRWDMVSGTCDSTFSLPRKNNVPVLIWSLVACGNAQIASGDSLGAVSLWGVNSCTMIQTRQDHQADVLVMHLDGGYLYTSGVDARVARYLIGSDGILSLVSVSALMSRDISALTVVGDLIVVGGADAKLGVASNAIPPKFPSLKLDRFRESLVVARSRVFVQDGLRTIKVYHVEAENEPIEYLAQLENDSDIKTFCVNEDGSRVIIADANLAVRTITVEDESIAEHSKSSISRPATASAVSDKFSVIAQVGGHLSVFENGKKKDEIHLSFKAVSRLVISGVKALAVAKDQLVYIANLGARSSSSKKHSVVLSLGSTITALSEVYSTNHILVATADHFIHCIALSDVALESVWKQRLSAKVKISKFHHVNSIMFEDSTIWMLGESFIATSATPSVDAEPKRGFKFNSTVPTGGVIVGTGRLCMMETRSPKKQRANQDKKTVMAVLASYKSTDKLLIWPFERRQFQQ